MEKLTSRLKALIGAAVVFAAVAAFAFFNFNGKGTDLQTNSFGTSLDAFNIEDLSYSGQLLTSDSDRVALFGVNFNNSVGVGDLLGLTLQIVSVSGASFDVASNSSSVLEILPDGVQLWKDDGNETFGTEDTFVNIDAFTTYQADGDNFALDVDLSSGAILNNDDTYFIVIKTPQYGVSHGDQFQIGLKAGNIRTTGTAPVYTDVLSEVMEINAYYPQVPMVTANGPLNNDSTTIEIYFDQSMSLEWISWAAIEGGYDPDYILYTYDADTYTYGTYGEGAVAVFSQNKVANDKLTINVGTGASILDGYIAWPSFNPSSGGWFQEGIEYDTTGPMLIDAVLVVDAGGDAQAMQNGDEIAFIFDKEIDQSTITPSNIDSRLDVSPGTLSNTVNPTLTWSSDNVLNVLLNAEQINSVGATVNVSTQIMDKNGNAAVANPTPVTVRISNVDNIDYVIFEDTDTETYGIDENDITVSWSAVSTGDHINVYVLPADESFDIDTQNPINSDPIAITATGYSAVDSDYYIGGDSRSNYVSWYPYYYFSSYDQYKAVVLVCNADETDCSFPAESSSIYFTSDNSYNYEMYSDYGWSSTYVQDTMPYGYSTVNNNYKVFGLVFSDPMDSDTITTGSLSLSVVDANWEVTDTIDGTVIYDSNEWVAYFTATETLPSNGTVKLELDSDAQDTDGGSVTYTTYFYTNSTPDSTVPSITWADPQDNASDVDTLISEILVGFNESLDPTTITSASFVATPEVSVNPIYDPYVPGISLQLNSTALTATIPYTITFLGNVIKDTAGNLMGSNYELNFVTGEVNTDAPSIKWLTFNVEGFEMQFDLPMKESTVTNVTNYTLVCAEQSISLSSASLNYDVLDRRLNVSGVPLTEGTDCTLTISASVQATNNQSIPSEQRTQDGSVEGYKYGNDYYDSYFSDYDSGSYDYVYQDPGVSFYNPFYAWPDCSITSCNTSYYFSFPLTQEIGDGDVIELVFPAGFDIGNASIDNNDYSNKDINGWEDGTVTIESIAADRSTRTVALTIDTDVNLAASGTSQLNFRVSNIVNPSTASDYDWSTQTGGYQVQFQTVDGTTDAVVEGPNSMQSFGIREGGNGIATITILEQESELPIEGVSLQIWAGEMGQQTITTDVNGEATLSGIPVNEWGNYVSVWSEPESVPDGYLGEWMSANFYLTTDAPTAEQTMYLKLADLQISGTITHANIGVEGDTSVNLWCNSWTSWSSKKIELDDDGSTTFSLALADDGWYTCGIDKYYDWNSGKYDQSEFITPSPENTELNEGNSPVTMNFTLEAADKTISGTVTDQDGSPLAYAYVSISSDQAASDKWFWSGTSTANDGTYSLAVTEGKYMMDVYYWGIPGNTHETVKVDEDDTNIVKDFVLRKPDISVTGNVSDGSGSGMQWAGVSGWSDDGQWVSTNTDINGDFTMFVNSGTWTFSAWGGQYGQLSAVDGVVATNRVITANVTGLNFAYDPDAYGDITGVLVDADSQPIANTWLWTDKIDTTNNNYAGWGNGAVTGSDGSFTINTLKNTSSEEYRLTMWDYQLGQVVLDSSIDISLANANLGTITLPATYTLTTDISGINNGQEEVWINFQNLDNHSWNWMNVVLDSGSGSSTTELVDGDYMAYLYLYGLGEFTEEFTIDGGDASIEFALDDVEVETITINVVDDNSEPLVETFVEAYDPDNDRYISGFTDENGDVDLTLIAGEDADYNIRASHEGYSSAIDTIDPSTDTEGELALTIADSVIEGQALDENLNPIAYAWIDAVNEDGTHTGTMTDGDGNYALDVPSDTLWDITIKEADGTYGIESDVLDGELGANIISDTTLEHFIQEDPLNTTIDPTQDNVITDELIDLTIPGGAISDDANGNNLTVNKTAAVPETETTSAMGDMAFDIDVSDSSGNNITNLNSEVTLEIKYTDADIEAMIDAEVIDITDIDAPLSYYNATNDTWEVIAGSTVFAEVQENSGEDYSIVDIDTFITDYDTYADYNDYEVHYLVSVDHFTLFAPAVSESSSSSTTNSNNNSNSNSNSSGSSNSSGNLSSYTTDSDEDESADTDLSGSAVEDDVSDGASEDTEDEVKVEVTTDTVEYETDENADYAGHWSEDYIAELYGRSIVSGCDEDGNYCPDSSISRSELLKIVLGTYGIEIDESLETNPFSDLSSDHWAYSIILTAYDKGIIKGYDDGTFKPDDLIDRAAAMKIVLEAANIELKDNISNIFKDVDETAWYANYVLTAYSDGIVKGYEQEDGTYFRPANPITRAESAKIVLETEKLGQ